MEASFNLKFNSPSAARIGFESTEYVVDEDDGSVTVVVSILDGELSGDVLVNISTTDGSATSSGKISLQIH